MSPLPKIHITLCSLIQLLLLPGLLWGDESQAVTKPSADINLSCGQPGKGHKVFVKEGSFVKKGDLLARQKNEVARNARDADQRVLERERARFELAKISNRDLLKTQNVCHDAERNYINQLNDAPQTSPPTANNSKSTTIDY
ncbi:MAG: hypothetical protein OEY01_05485 [Desulfobulbaceae bacterium]|nr:hypothetical protein [Desulfobulbaceae bacterium]HIJ78561.1 hypothetical protein [Deltaproteobacteria bacterium]